MDRLYCSVSELCDDLDLPGVKRESQVLGFIRSASEWIDNNLGQFLPSTETKRFDGNGRRELWIDPILTLTEIVVDETTLASTDYLLYPRQRCWGNGPYDRLHVDPDAVNLSSFTRELDVIKITGSWGLYDVTQPTGATVASQTDTATSLVVSNAGAISPGCLLLIGSEQELVTATGAASDSTADTSEGLDVSEEEIDVTNGALFFAGELIRVDFEQMRIVDISTNTLLVARGYNATKRTTHLTGASVYVYRTFTVTRAANGTTAAAHTTAAITRYVPPADVNYLARQITALMLRKSQTGYAGRTGNTELGQVFYHDEFPRDAIAKIKQAYYLPDYRWRS
jgi:hypothetical protein